MGAWQGHGGSITVFEDNAWIYLALLEGMQIFVSEEQRLYVYNGTNLVPCSPALEGA
jgi:hypothetical protein